jgi:hypothetical protein
MKLQANSWGDRQSKQEEVGAIALYLDSCSNFLRLQPGSTIVTAHAFALNCWYAQAKFKK